MRETMILAAAAIAVGVVSITGCQESAKAPSGPSLYSAKCSSCHRLIAPQEHTAEQWRFYVDKYGKKMTDSQKTLVLEHLTGDRKGDSTP